MTKIKLFYIMAKLAFQCSKVKRGLEKFARVMRKAELSVNEFGQAYGKMIKVDELGENK